MILGFLGKGGSGKSSLSTQTALLMHRSGKCVLAVDADHNMDLSFNLTGGEVGEFPFFGSSIEELYEMAGLSEEQKYDQVFLNDTDLKFSFSNPDVFTEKFSKEVKERMRLMAAGPQTDRVLYGKNCSHSLTTPLKVYLPLLELQEKEVVVVDEKAGADGVTTGVVTGIDVGVIVCEPALHSIKTAKQIAELLDFYGTPYVFVGNKITGKEDKDFVVGNLGPEAEFFFGESRKLKQDPSEPEEDWQESLEALFEKTTNLNRNNRLERTKEKFKRNQVFASA